MIKNERVSAMGVGDHDFFEFFAAVGATLLGLGLLWWKTDWVVALSVALLILGLMLFITFYIRTVSNVLLKNTQMLSSKFRAKGFIDD